MVDYSISCILSCLLNLGATLLTGPQAVVTEDVQGNVLTVSWPTPSNTNFLVAYRVSYSTSTSSARSRRQTTQTREVPTGTTSTTLDFAAFTDYTVNVDAIYAPPPDGNNVTVNLLPPTMFTTPQRRKKSVYSGINLENNLSIWGGGGGGGGGSYVLWNLRGSGLLYWKKIYKYLLIL